MGDLWKQLNMDHHMKKLSEFHLDWRTGVDIAFSKDFPVEKSKVWMDEHWYFFVQAMIAYFVTIFSIKFFMRNREPFNLQLPLNIWNSILAVFSIAGAYFLAEEFFTSLFKGFRATWCDRGEMMVGVSARWTYYFMVSKLFEFADTLFIVLRKKPLMFLHWYHHILTLCYGVYSYSAAPAYNRWGVYLNFAVHSFMYSYYFLRSIHVPIPGYVAKAITTGQILQFVISILVLVCRGIEHYVLGWTKCDFDLRCFWFAVFMDTTYLILFVNFFLQSYVIKGGKAKYADKKGADKKKQ